MQTKSAFLTCTIAATLSFGILVGVAQTGNYLYSGSLQTITLGPGFYDITTYGAEGGGSGIPGSGANGGLGAEMEGEFDFSVGTTLTLLVGGAGSPFGNGGTAGGGGGSFVVNGTTPLVIAGGGGGFSGVFPGAGGNGSTSTAGLGSGGAGGVGGLGGTGDKEGGAGGGGFSGDGGNTLAFGGGFDPNGAQGGSSFLDGGAGGLGAPGHFPGGNGGFGGGGGGYSGGGGGGGGGYSGGGGGPQGDSDGGGGGGSIIDPSAIAVITEISGVASPDDSQGNGEIIITSVPEPATVVLAGLGGLSFLLLRRGK